MKSLKKVYIFVIVFILSFSIVFTPIVFVASVAKHPFSFASTVFKDFFDFEVSDDSFKDVEKITGGQTVQIFFEHKPNIKDDIMAHTSSKAHINKVAIIIIFYGLNNYTVEDLKSIISVFENAENDEEALAQLQELSFIKNSQSSPLSDTVLKALQSANMTLTGGASNIEGLTVRSTSPASETHNPYFYGDKNIYVPNFIGQCTWYSFSRIMEMAAEISYPLDMSAMMALHSNGGDWYNCALTEQTTFQLSTDVSQPRAGAVISWSGGQYEGEECGHVAVVEKVNEDGTIAISEGWYSGGVQFSYNPSVTLDSVLYRPSAYPDHPYRFNGYIYCIDVPEKEDEETKETQDKKGENKNA